jgi:pilus assembly protein Flp/PilA
MQALLARFAAEEGGSTAIEYGLLSALVAVAGIAALQALGLSVVQIFERVTEIIERVNDRAFR